MRDYTQEELEARYQKLPAPLKEALFSPDIAYSVFDAGKKYNMTIDQIGNIADEVGYVILGLTRPNEFISNLTERLGIDSDTARAIALEINQTVFASLQSLLRDTHKIEITDKEFSGTPAPQKPPTPKPAHPIAPPRPIEPTHIKPVVEIKKVTPPAPPPAPAPKEFSRPTSEGGLNFMPPPSKPPIYLKDLEEDEIEAETEEDNAKAAPHENEEEEFITDKEPLKIPASPPPGKQHLPAQEITEPTQQSRPLPSWIQEQDAKKTQPPPIKPIEKTPEIPPARFTLDLRAKKQEDPPKIPVSPPPALPSKQIPPPIAPQAKTQEIQSIPTSAPAEIAAVLQDEKDIPPFIPKTPDLKPTPSHTQKPSATPPTLAPKPAYQIKDPYKEPLE